ncbi:MAG: hypothetical protein ABI315_09775 [Bacteroidia bacterium]
MDDKVLLKRGIKTVFIFCLFFISSCSNSVKKVEEKKADFYANKNYSHYSNIYSTLIDSINIYVDSSLNEFLGETLWPWEVDSLICINSNNTKLVSTINSSSGSCKKCVSDAITKLLGKKINGKWYFFKGGGTLIVPRDLVGKDEIHPLSFHELSQIAREEFLESALIKNAAGEYVVNDKWIDAHFYNNGFASMGWNEIKDKAKYDSVHWYYILHKWKVKIDTNEYKPFRRKIEMKPAT